MTESAIFIGRDGSYGYHHGFRYTVDVHANSTHIYVNGIPYDTVCAVSKNWRFIGK